MVRKGTDVESCKDVRINLLCHVDELLKQNIIFSFVYKTLFVILPEM